MLLQTVVSILLLRDIFAIRYKKINVAKHRFNSIFPLNPISISIPMVTPSVALSVCEQQESCNVVCRNDGNLFFISDIILVLEHQEMAGVDTMPCWMNSDPGPKTFFFSGEMYVDQSESIFWEGCRKYGGSPGFMMNDDDISNVKNTLGQDLTTFGQWIPIYGAEKRFADTGLTLPSDHYLHDDIKYEQSITDGHCYRYLLDKLMNRNCIGNNVEYPRHLICFKY